MSSDETATTDVYCAPGQAANCTLKATTHLEMEPQPVLRPKRVLPHVYVILQPIVRCACEAKVAALKVTAEGEIGRRGNPKPCCWGPAWI